MKEEIVKNFLDFTDKYGLNPSLLGSLLVLVAIIFKIKRLTKEEEIKKYEYPPLVLGILVFFVLLFFAFK